MLNNEKLSEVLESYKASFESRWEGERYKWEALKWFQDKWDINAENFSEMLSAATAKTSNLLASMNNFPRKMIVQYAQQEPETVRAMFIALYDETKNVADRVIKFQKDAQELCDKLTPGLQHYQRPMAITVYLWLRYPDKYDVFKYSVCKATSLYLESDFVPKKGNTSRNIKGNMELIDEILAAVNEDEELVNLFHSKLDEDCYKDESHRTLAFDVSFYVAAYLADKAAPDNAWIGEDYNPGIAKEQWIETYTKEDFLKEVYMGEEKYETLKNLLLKKQNVIMQGAPGVGKTYAAKRLAYSIIGAKDESRIEFIQFHQNYSYEDFIMGYKPSGEGFELQKGIFYKFCLKAANNPDIPYFFIIDEINRGNMSKIFGELLMLIEKDYRGTKATLAYNGLQFSVPKNLYIIGMMNTADRSLAMIDYALRRRFSFFSMEPGFTTDGFVEYMKSLNDDTFESLIDVVASLNQAIAQDSSLGKGFCIGHSYFCGQKKADEEEMLGWMSSVVDYDILPMLEEYWFDEPDKITYWRNRLQGVFND